ncbi:MAG: hypothetical protein KatS3mg014_2456 [Actinomycetota bacterium]|nr:MAG: hypothetical protein KatS3mg014_2456 [Actinomycetota bacterium]
MAAEISNCDTCNGGLVFDAFGPYPAIDLLNGKAWCALDTSDLWKQEVRGEDRIVPGLEGSRPYPRLRAAVTMQFPLVVVGARDPSGALFANPVAGLAANLAFLRDNLEAPVSVGDGTRPLTWTRPDGVVLRAQVHVVPPLEHRIGPGATCRAVLTISVPRPFAVV